MKTLMVLLVFGILAFSGCKKEAPVLESPKPQLQQWEYQQVDWPADTTNMNLTVSAGTPDTTEKLMISSTKDLFDFMGKRSWELVTVAAGPGGATYFFKRPRQHVLEMYIYEPQRPKKEKPLPNPTVFK